MSERTLRCGNCGADVTFTSPGTLMVVCEHCSWSNARGDVDLDKLGLVSAVDPIASQFGIGTEGRYADKPFVVRGQLQLDHGLGVWNEWAAEDGDGEWFWIAEAQGRYLVFHDAETPGPVDPSEVSVGAHVTLPADKQRYQVTEVGQGRVVTVRGELPVELAVGETTRYADLQRGADAVGTLDWTRGDEPEVLVGRAVRLAELQLDPVTQPEHRPDTVESWSFDCKHCGGSLTVVDPENSSRVGCSHCGHLLDVTADEVRVVEQQTKITKTPAIPLGSRGVLKGQEYQVLGLMQRRVKDEGKWYPWREYLLRTPEGAYHWLIETDGHWMLGRPIQHSAVTRKGGKALHGGEEFRHFTTGKAIVHWVVGEFYWQVQSGEESHARDYVKSGWMVSTEGTDTELHATLSEYVTPDEIAAGFEGFKKPSVRGVGPIQPNPHHARRGWLAFAIAIVLLIIVRIVVAGGHENRVVFAGTFGPLPKVNTEEHVVFSDPFELTADEGNVVVRMSVPGVSNGWIGLNGALVNEESGAVTTFATQAQYYSGTDGGERWTEGNRRGRTILGSVPAGRYRLRLAASGWEDGLGRTYSVDVKSQVPRTLFFVLALLAVLVFPVVNSIVHIAFEKTRWANSDHPWSSD